MLGGHKTSKDVQEVIPSLISVGEGGGCLFCCLLPLYLLTKLEITIYYFSSKPFSTYFESVSQNM